MLYTPEEVAKILKVNYMYVYKMLNYCCNCRKTKTKCKCDDYETTMKGVDIRGKNSKHAIWRVPEEEIKRLMKVTN
jgi:hypothetical protein